MITAGDPASLVRYLSELIRGLIEAATAWEQTPLSNRSGARSAPKHLLGHDLSQTAEDPLTVAAPSGERDKHAETR